MPALQPRADCRLNYHSSCTVAMCLKAMWTYHRDACQCLATQKPVWLSMSQPAVVSLPQGVRQLLKDRFKKRTPLIILKISQVQSCCGTNLVSAQLLIMLVAWVDWPSYTDLQFEQVRTVKGLSGRLIDAQAGPRCIFDWIYCKFLRTCIRQKAL